MQVKAEPLPGNYSKKFFFLGDQPSLAKEPNDSGYEIEC